MLSDRIKAMLFLVAAFVALLVFLAGFAFAALVAGWLGVVFLGVYVGLVYWSLSEWYTARVLARRERRLSGAPALRTE